MGLTCPACSHAIDPDGFDDDGRVACGGCGAPLLWDGALRPLAASEPAPREVWLAGELTPAPLLAQAMPLPPPLQPQSDRWMYATLAASLAALVAIVAVHLARRPTAQRIPTPVLAASAAPAPPATAPPAPPAITPPPTLETLRYARDAVALPPGADATLETARRALLAAPARTLEIHGHTDEAGRRDANLVIARRRAEGVAAWMTEHGIAAARLIVHVHGPDRPVGRGRTAEARARNRRVELMVVE